MNEIIKLAQNLNNYIQQASEPSLVEYFAKTICPILTTLAIIIGGCFALYKYMDAKNYDINIKILNEVYIPLYSYLIKQETFRFIAMPDITWEQEPIIEVKKTKKIQRLDASGLTQEQVIEGVCGCTKDALLDLCEQTNLGLASTELVTLLNIYKILVYVTTGNINTEEKAKAYLLQEKVEIALRNEILKGYKYYHRKLKLRNSYSGIFNISEEQIELLPQITQEEIEKALHHLNKIQE